MKLRRPHSLQERSAVLRCQLAKLAERVRRIRCRPLDRPVSASGTAARWVTGWFQAAAAG